MFLIARGTVLGYSYGEVFEVDDTNAGELKIIEGYVAGGFLEVLPDGPPDASTPAPADGSSPVLIPEDLDVSTLPAPELLKVAAEYDVDVRGATRVGPLRTLITKARTDRARTAQEAGPVAVGGADDSDGAAPGPEGGDVDSGPSPQS